MYSNYSNTYYIQQYQLVLSKDTIIGNTASNESRDSKEVLEEPKYHSNRDIYS